MFEEKVLQPLQEQEKAIGEENIKDYRICAHCLEYVLRETYEAHCEQVHGYTILHITEALNGR